MSGNRPVAERHDAEWYKNRRVPAAAPAPTGESARQIEPPKIAHFAGPNRPIVTTSPKEPLRLTRADIERALVGSHTYAPHQDEIVDRIVMETSRMDQHPEDSVEFRTHQQTILRELRMLGLYPVDVG